jgi:hypothetical protein
VLIDDVVLGVVDNAQLDDPNELSFKKGETLEILDKSGKWWEARRGDGVEGSESRPFFSVCYVTDSTRVVVPSNYMKIV